MSITRTSLYHVSTNDGDISASLSATPGKVTIDLTNAKPGIYAGELITSIEIDPKTAYELAPILKSLAEEAGYKDPTQAYLD